MTRYSNEPEIINIPFDAILADTGEGGAKLFLDDTGQHWIPNSLIEDVYSDNSVDIPRWYAEKYGLI